MTTLVTGGCGYIGAHVVDELHKIGERVIVVDDLSYGKASRIGEAKFVKMNVSDNDAEKALAYVMKENAVDSVIHFAARKQVGESVEKPMYYYKENIHGIENIINAMLESGAKSLVFSSSAATYGQPDEAVVSEDVNMKPINPYGETKLIGEWIARAAAKVSPLRFCGLRYFNVAGAGRPELGDPAILNLVPMVFDKLANGENPKIFGADYDTPDGTCVRDYIHVVDLAKAHIMALDYLKKPDSQRPFDVFNVGTGKGTSVKEIIDAIRAETKLDFEADIEPRRPGDPALLIGSPKRINETLNWYGENGVKEIIASAFAAWQAGDRPIKRA
jgi:UDP-glucose 4-epimerase